MKKLVLLAAFALLGGSLMSCDNERTNKEGNDVAFNTDDGLVPPKPPKPPFPPLSNGKIN